jgi:glycosyltransferase involved in cell wall biosynthesis
VNAETGGAALARLRALKSSGRSLMYNGPGTDEEIEQAYHACTFTVYPSIAEGFGLPVIESLAHGKPCICSGRGALGEITRGGGCVPLDQLNAVHLADAMAALLDSPAKVNELSQVARERHFKSWADYSRELVAWMQSLPRR